MKATEKSLPEASNLVPVNRISIGRCFLHRQAVHIRLKPTSFLLNSSIIQDKLAVGWTVVANLEKGTVYLLSGDTGITPVNADVHWSLYKE